MPHIVAGLDQNRLQPPVGAKHVATHVQALKRVRLKKHSVDIRHLKQLLQDSGDDVEEARRPYGTQIRCPRLVPVLHRITRSREWESNTLPPTRP